MNEPCPNCKYCHGTGIVTDYVPYGSTNVPMDSDCDCIEYPVFIEFLASTPGNDCGDIVEIEYENKMDIYYTDTNDRWCYLPKNLENIAFVYTESDK